MTLSNRGASSGKRIKMPSRRAIHAGERAVRGGPLLDDRAIPYLLRPQAEGVDLVEWAGQNRDFVEQRLFEHRALLFRGFGVDSVEQFEQFVENTSDGERLEYRDRSTPRTTEGHRIYTSTVHPPDQEIVLHNEGTYWTRWAQKLYFCCLEAAPRGGATPIADVRRVYERVPEPIRAKFVALGMMLVRNYNDGFGLPWQDVYQTEDKAEVEAYCRENQIEFTWKKGDKLRTWQVRPAIRRHPRSREPVWFNHAAFFHHSSLPATMLELLTKELGEDGLPYDTRYGDGTPIEAEAVRVIREAYRAERVVFPWRQGDVMLLDNMTVAHGREPYEGRRRVVVAMTDAVSEEASLL